MAWGMIGAAGVTLVGSMLTSDSGGGGGSSGGSSSTSAYDPYAQYRPAAATKLNDLMNNPSSIQNLPEYQAQMQAASRTSAAQGYTGSGNALVAAANAGGQAYQQAFNNLAMLAGAGQSPALAQNAANQQANYQQQANNQMWGQIGNVVGQGINGFSNSSGSSLPAIDTGSYSPSVGGFDTSINVPAYAPSVSAASF